MKCQFLAAISLSLVAQFIFAADQLHPSDTRQVVKVPAAVRVHFLAGMRHHLTEMADIQAALANGEFEHAAQIAQQHLGLSAPGSAACRMPSMAGSPSAVQHFASISGAQSASADIAPYMPKAMHDAGVSMHHAADQFVTVSRASAATSNYPATLRALSKVTEGCVACHAQFRVVEDSDIQANE
uniref:Cytochrome c n=1 Tax=mine drainage metagenome TaxID=410659 RepID=E6QRP3_9ZZZZ